MNLVIYIVSAAFALLAVALLFSYYRTRHAGLLLMAISYGMAALLAVTRRQWWPLVVGFALVWVLKLLGYDPGAPTREN